MRLSVLWVSALATFLTASRTYSDSWVLPVAQEYYSEDREFRLTVIPRDLMSQLHYFSDRARGREPAGQLPGGVSTCTGILSRRNQQGSYETLWQRPLSNNVSPVSAIVSRSGDRVVTFDNWHAMGYGRNAVVIYGPEGNLVREFSLRDLMTEEEIQKLPRSVSSIWWGSGHRFDESGQFLVLRIIANGEMPGSKTARFRLLRIELTTGKIVKSESGAWSEPEAKPGP